MSKPEFTCSVATRFLPEQSDPAQSRYAFAYTIVIHNSGDVPAQLIARHWHITDSSGRTQEVRGLGVVGEQPLLRPGEHHEYSSWVQIATPRGQMRGTYFCVTDEAEFFEAPVPTFELSQHTALH
jgi:ApaG protein